MRHNRFIQQIQAPLLINQLFFHLKGRRIRNETENG